MQVPSHENCPKLCIKDPSHTCIFPKATIHRPSSSRITPPINEQSYCPINVNLYPSRWGSTPMYQQSIEAIITSCLSWASSTKHASLWCNTGFTRSTLMVQWCAPQPGWVKVDVDGACNPCRKRLVVNRWVIRDEELQCIVAFASVVRHIWELCGNASVACFERRIT
ncbi:hypothetical protein GOBAR_AA36781 [Gossypium barbadense]|uniref:Uncharacterized protein n=1 Tax=Gossypium barbadense TaxID=3634 RepID=A0A2P5VYL3_GOSBA|nr:hypothetical protein GOBAR_AA36781 [Gossypium barbadense]